MKSAVPVTTHTFVKTLSLNTFKRTVPKRPRNSTPVTEVYGRGVMSAQHARKWCTQLENYKISMTMVTLVELAHTDVCESNKRRGTDLGKLTSRNIGFGTVHSSVL
jgi:hypothetical protein